MSLTHGVWMMRVMAPDAVVMIGFVLSALSAVALTYGAGSPVAALALGAGFGLVQGASFAAVAHLNAALEDRALANGGLAQMGNLGNTSGTPLMVLVIAGFGYAGFMGLTAILLMAGAIVHLGLARVRARGKSINPLD